MELKTCSEVISFTRKLEEKNAAFYETFAKYHPQNSEVLLSMATENRKNITQVERAYYSVISDALEGCFVFCINPDKYSIPVQITEGEYFTQTLEKAIEMEGIAKRYFTDAAEQSRALIADVSRAFSIIARKRDSRISTLKSMLDDQP